MGFFMDKTVIVFNFGFRNVDKRLFSFQQDTMILY